MQWRFLPALLMTTAVAARPIDVDRMQQVVQAFADDGQFMGAVLVATKDRVVFERADGEANLEWHVPNTVDTRFRLASITKQFTAAAILLLEEQGALQLNDRVADYMPDLPEAWRDITIFELLTHTSGLPSITAVPDFARRERLPTTPLETLHWVWDQPLIATPGTEYHYSNAGYILLGHLIELLSGETYADFLKERIFVPLGMQNTGYDDQTRVLERRASGYERDGTGYRNADYIDMSVPFAAGALYSTTHDLLLWVRGLFGGKVVSAASLQRMTTAFLDGYGLGVKVNQVNGRVWIEHGGSVSGVSTRLAYQPESETTVVVLENIGTPSAAAIGRLLGQIAEGDEVHLASESDVVQVAPEVLARYAGAYRLGESTARFEIDGGRLILVNRGRRAPLQASSETEFFLTAGASQAVSMRFTFLLDEADRVTGVRVVNGNGQAFTLTPDRSAARPGVEVPEAVLARYVGRYELAQDFYMQITLEDGRLMAQATGQAKSALSAKSATEFATARDDIRFEFVIEDGGAPELIVHRSGASDIRAPRR